MSEHWKSLVHSNLIEMCKPVWEGDRLLGVGMLPNIWLESKYYKYLIRIQILQIFTNIYTVISYSIQHICKPVWEGDRLLGVGMLPNIWLESKYYKYLQIFTKSFRIAYSIYANRFWEGDRMLWLGCDTSKYLVRIQILRCGGRIWHNIDNCSWNTKC